MDSTVDAASFKGRSLLTLEDYTEDEINFMLTTAAKYKKMKKEGQPHREHEGKNIVLLFEKASTRTRSAFEVSAADLGMNASYYGKNDIHMGHKETIEDTAKVLGRMFDGIEFRGFAQKSVEDLAKYSGVPVWNGLTDATHPTQILADFLTIQEHIGPLNNTKLAFVGDGSSNMANSEMIGAAIMGLDFRIGAPKELHPQPELVEKAHQLAEKSGAKITITDSPQEAVKDVDVVYTDVWVSMGEEDQFAERIKLLRDYQVNMDLIRASGNDNVKFMHCLPAFHNTDTEVGKQVKEKYGLDAMEVTDEVFNSPHSIVFDQAENRMHTIKAVLALTMK